MYSIPCRILTRFTVLLSRGDFLLPLLGAFLDGVDVGFAEACIVTGSRFEIAGQICGRDVVSSEV